MGKTRGKRRRLNDPKDSEEITTSSTEFNKLSENITQNSMNDRTRIVEQSSNELREIVQKLFGEVINMIKNQSEQTRQCIIDLFSSKTLDANLNKELTTTLLERNQKYMTVVTEKICESLNTSIKTSFQIDTDPTIHRKPKFHEETYNKRLKERKLIYWKYHRTKSLHAIYSEELKKDTPRMPRKLRPVTMSNEPSNELAVRKRLAIEKFKHETKLLLLRSERFKNNFQQIDKKLEELAIEKLPEPLAEEQINNWRRDCKLEEERSHSLFKRKEEWIKKNLTDELRVKGRKRIKDSETNRIDLTSNLKKKPRWNHNRKKQTRRTQEHYKNGQKDNLRYINSKKSDIAVRHFESNELDVAIENNYVTSP